MRKQIITVKLYYSLLNYVHITLIYNNKNVGAKIKIHVFKHIYLLCNG